MTIDEYMSWQDHINHCKCKVSSGLYALNSSKHILSSNHMQIMYYSLINSYLEYGILLWGSASQTHLKKLEILQNKAMRIITGVAYNSSSGPLYKKLNILPLNLLYRMHLGKLMYLYDNNQLPLPLQNKFVRNRDIHGHNTRSRNRPHVDSRNSSITSKTFIHKAPQFWYNLTPVLTQAKTVKSFITRYKKELLTAI